MTITARAPPSAGFFLLLRGGSIWRRAVHRNSRWPRRGRGANVQPGPTTDRSLPFRISVSRGLTERPCGSVVGRLLDSSTRKSRTPEHAAAARVGFVRGAARRSLKWENCRLSPPSRMQCGLSRHPGRQRCQRSVNCCTSLIGFGCAATLVATALPSRLCPWSSVGVPTHRRVPGLQDKLDVDSYAGTPDQLAAEWAGETLATPQVGLISGGFLPLKTAPRR